MPPPEPFVSTRFSRKDGTFREDIGNNSPIPMVFNGGPVWARQLNQEPQGLHIQNNGTKLWILGLKTERAGTLIDTENGGYTELLGGFSYTTTSEHNKSVPMFIINNANASFTFHEVNYGGWPGGWPNIVQETRGKTTLTLTNTQCLQLTGGSDLPLYTGYTSTPAQ